MVKVYQGRGGGLYVQKGGQKLYLPKSRVVGRGRYRRTIRGRGGYKDWLGTAIRGTAGAIGGIAGYMSAGAAKAAALATGNPTALALPSPAWGAAKGAALGSGLAGMATGLLGLGKYRKRRGIQGLAGQMKSNTLLGIAVDSTTAGSQLRVQNSASQPYVIRHTEYLGDILSTTQFRNEAYLINPGNRKMFPWLATIASKFEQWEPRGIIFEYRTTSVDSLNSLNTALGSIIMATDYNAGSAKFTSKSQMENTEYMSSGKPSCSFLHPIECSPRENGKRIFFVNTSSLGSLPDNTSLLDYYLGKFQIATNANPQDGNTLGELYVHYEVAFYKPVLDATVEVIPRAMYAFTGCTAAHPFGVIGTQQRLGTDTIGVRFEAGDPGPGDAITINNPLPDTFYMCVIQWRGTAASASGTFGPTVVGINGDGISTLAAFVLGSGNECFPTAADNTTIILFCSFSRCIPRVLLRRLRWRGLRFHRLHRCRFRFPPGCSS